MMPGIKPSFTQGKHPTDYTIFGPDFQNFYTCKIWATSSQIDVQLLKPMIQGPRDSTEAKALALNAADSDSNPQH